MELSLPFRSVVMEGRTDRVSLGWLPTHLHNLVAAAQWGREPKGTGQGPSLSAQCLYPSISAHHLPGTTSTAGSKSSPNASSTPGDASMSLHPYLKSWPNSGPLGHVDGKPDLAEEVCEAPAQRDRLGEENGKKQKQNTPEILRRCWQSLAFRQFCTHFLEGIIACSKASLLV